MTETEDKAGSFINFDFHYNNDLQYLCMKNAFSQLLEYYEYQNPLLYLKTGFELKIKVENGRFGVFKQWQCYPFHEMDKVRTGKGKDFKQIFWQNLKDAPVITLCDVFYLPYRNEYHKYHAGHFILLFDYNEESRRVGITDWYAPHFFKGYIELEHYKNARTSVNPLDIFAAFSGKEINNYWFYLARETSLMKPEENYEANVGDMCRVIHNPDANIYSQAAAVEVMKSLIAGLSGANEAYAKKIMDYYHNQIFIYYRTSVFARKYFEQAAEVLNIQSARKYKEFAAKCSSILDKLNFTLIRSCVQLNDKNIKKLLDLLDLLEEQYQELK